MKDMHVLKQHGAQLEGLVSDIRTIAQNIILDERIQSFCNEKHTNYQEVNKIADYLTSQINIKMHIHSASILCDSGSYWSAFPTDEVLQKKLQESWYTNLRQEEGRYGFSDVHELRYGFQQQTELLTYRTLIFDTETPTKKIGELMIHIDVSHLKRMIEEWDNTYNIYGLYNQDSAIYPLEQEDSLRNQVEFSLKSQTIQQTGLQQTKIQSTGSQQTELKLTGLQEAQIQKTKEGYLLSYPIKETDWTLVAYSNNQILSGRAQYLLVFFAFFTPATILILLWGICLLIHRFTSPIKVLSDGISDFSNGKMDTYVDIRTNDELELLANKFNYMIERINQYIENAIENEKTKKKLEFDMLISKIHPHFIYNTLNSVIYMARKEGNQDIIQMVKSFILILQDSMSVHEEMLFDTVQKELSVTEAYCIIQNYRYKNKVSLTLCVDDMEQDTLIPKNILQPLVENAIFHGLSLKPEKGEIKITIQRIGEYLNITVADDGVGMSSEVREGILMRKQLGKDKNTVHGIGTKNILDRLEYLYGSEYQFHISSEVGKGTEITIVVKAGTFFEKEEEDET